MSAGWSFARRSCEILSFTLRAGSVSMRSTKSQGMVRGGICRNRARKATKGTTPFNKRRMAPRGPTSTEPIDDLLIEQVASQQEHAFRAIPLGPVRQGNVRANTTVDRGHRHERQQAIASARL